MLLTLPFYQWGVTLVSEVALRRQSPLVSARKLCFIKKEKI